MIIAVNARLLLKDKLEGIGWFTFETLKRITKLHPEHQFIFIFDRPFSNDFIFTPNVKPVVLSPPTRHPVLWFLWFELLLPKLLKKIKADLFFSPDGFIPLRTNVKTITTIHDINFVHRPKDLPFLVGWYYNFFFPRIAQKADRITTVSEYSKNDIAKSYSISPDKIGVVYNGANSIYKPLNENEKSKIKEDFSQGNEYFIFVGALNPRKNVSGLFRAFDMFKETTNLKHKLVIVGEKMFINKQIKNTLSSMIHANDVIFLGRLSPDDLRNVLASAQAMTFVPFFEGFGIPLIEAMQCDTPILASNATSLPEVAGDAAIYVDPNSIEEIALEMQKLATDENLRKQLIEKGRLQRDKFSWDKTAEKLWKNIELCF